MKKILFVATVQSHIMNFHVPYLEYWANRGYEVHVATKMNKKEYKETELTLGYVKWHQIDFDRNPFSKYSIIALKQLKQLMKANEYELVHVHTPVGSILGRLAAKLTGTKNIVYTAHGFHFYKGAPIMNWVVYYPIEKFMARWTDSIITINQEDYLLAKKKFKTRKNGNVFKVDGVGIDLNKYKTTDIEDKDFKSTIGINRDDFVVSIIGELNNNKNHMQLIKSVEKVKEKHKNLKCLIVGNGENEKTIREYIENKSLNESILLLGFRRDIPNILSITDVVVSMSKREGLPKNIMEAMAAGKAIIGTEIRGNKDLIKDHSNGYLVEIDDINKTSEYIEKLMLNKSIVDEFSKQSIIDAQKYDIKTVIKYVDKEIYIKLIGENWRKENFIDNEDCVY
ncbi:glycosyltransferase family 4 protein [Paraclostridium bifermentans]|uniref:glycosyltransferase family 4 protein n=1 Tax=Paraclostridium bifermentans TaxID=1490 RepID=UPI0024B8E135|nr:glycosyltransferase family 4 protein [Paraclostridium bifermentans]